MEKQELKKEDISIEKLSESNRDMIDTFNAKACIELDSFLKENAWDEHLKDYSKTYLIFHCEKLVGYMTLLADKQNIKIENTLLNESLDEFFQKTSQGYSSIPALKIGRLCVADEYNSQLFHSKYKGLGKIIMSIILDYAKKLQSSIGCRLITTNAKKETKAYLWYEKVGFRMSFNSKKTQELLSKESEKSIPMFFDINRVVK